MVETKRRKKFRNLDLPECLEGIEIPALTDVTEDDLGAEEEL